MIWSRFCSKFIFLGVASTSEVPANTCQQVALLSSVVLTLTVGRYDNLPFVCHEYRWLSIPLEPVLPVIIQTSLNLFFYFIIMTGVAYLNDGCMFWQIWKSHTYIQYTIYRISSHFVCMSGVIEWC